MLNYFVMGELDSRDAHVYCQPLFIVNVPEDQNELVAINGKNGDLILSSRRFSNIEITLQCVMIHGFNVDFDTFRCELMSMCRRYYKLTDPSFPNAYRLASVVRVGSIHKSNSMDKARFDIILNCKPQLYLTSGDKKTTFTQSGTVENPTKFDALPVLRIYGTGEATIGDTVITIKSSSGYVDFDCERMECSYNGRNWSEYVEMSTNDYPILKNGTNTIGLGTGITKIEVTPRWWMP